MGLLEFWSGRVGEISLFDKNTIFKLQNGLVLRVECERDVSGVLGWRVEHWTIACEFVGCDNIFWENTILVPLIGEGVRKYWLVLPMWLKSSSERVMASSERIMVWSNWLPGRRSGSGFFWKLFWFWFEPILKRSKKPSSGGWSVK